ncbi:MAG: hypothetical protein QW416_07125 [Candidatus Nitrosocaldaceae archaeon]
MAKKCKAGYDYASRFINALRLACIGEYKLQSYTQFIPPWR